MRIKNFRPHIAILTNIAIDHLNWHRDMNEYISAKKKIFMNQTNDDYALLNYDDERVRIISEELNSKKIFFGRNCYEGAWLDGMLHFHSEEIVSSEEIPLIGEHNRFNALAAIAAGKVLKISNDAIKNGLKNFKPLVHRLEDLGIIDGIRYINNSMSTNEASAIASFKAVVGNKIVIVGGRKKGDRCENYLRLLIKEAKAVVLLGENAEEIGQFFKESQYKNFAIAENMDDAISKAKGYAQQGDIIMLNPGFASFGHFRDFQERGEAFKNGVLKS
jgi:UDP-N-acetylmuramoylalanine--D-glutamate ligase